MKKGWNESRVLSTVHCESHLAEWRSCHGTKCRPSLSGTHLISTCHDSFVSIIMRYTQFCSFFGWTKSLWFKVISSVSLLPIVPSIHYLAAVCQCSVSSHPLVQSSLVCCCCQCQWKCGINPIIAYSQHCFVSPSPGQWSSQWSRSRVWPVTRWRPLCDRCRSSRKWEQL